MSGEESASLSPASRFWVLAVLLFISLWMSWDLINDWGEGVSLSHAVAEGTAAILSFVTFLYLVRDGLRLRRRVSRLHTELEKTRGDLLVWKQNSARFAEGLSNAIDEQFELWKFSPAEKDVALLILKGLGLKEIAELRGRSERTVRQQATQVYEKAALKGRNELAAFFLEDLLHPRGAQNISQS